MCWVVDAVGQQYELEVVESEMEADSGSGCIYDYMEVRHGRHMIYLVLYWTDAKKNQVKSSLT